LAAREACAKDGQRVEYIDVLAAPENLAAMLKLSRGNRKVPVIVTAGEVVIGFHGKG
jgi:glutaredoxin